jgi:hypothetical protein
MITWILLFVVLVIVGKLIYDRKRETTNPTEGGLVDNEELKEAQEMKDKFQTLAGIKPHNSQKGTNDLVDVLMKAEQIKKDGFPPESESIPVNSFPITKIKLNEDSDPLSDIPLSRISTEAKKKMAEIAMKDLSDRLEETTSKFQPINSDELVEKPVKKKRKYNRNPKK